MGHAHGGAPGARCNASAQQEATTPQTSVHFVQRRHLEKACEPHTQCYGCWTSGHRATRGEDDDEEYEGESEGESDDT